MILPKSGGKRDVTRDRNLLKMREIEFAGGCYLVEFVFN